MIRQQNASVLTHTQIKAEMWLLHVSFAAAARFDLKPFLSDDANFFFIISLQTAAFQLSRIGSKLTDVLNMQASAL